MPDSYPVSSLALRIRQRLVAKNWTLLRRIIAGLLVFGSLLASVFAAIWLVGDFVALSVSSPNLDPASHVADFDEFSYIGQALREYRFNFGLMAAVMAVAMVMLAIYLLQPRPATKGLFVSGGIALLIQVVFLVQTFYLPFFLMLVGTALALFLAPEVEADSAESETPEPEFEEQQQPELVQDDQGSPEEDQSLPSELPKQAGWVGQPESAVLLATEKSSEPALEPTLAEPGERSDDRVDPVFLEDLSEDLIQQVLSEESGEHKQPAVTPNESLDLSNQDESLPPVIATSILPPPEGRRFGEKPRVWNLMDWIILALMLVGILGIAMVLLAR